jgi:hypothetical protein
MDERPHCHRGQALGPLSRRRLEGLREFLADYPVAKTCLLYGGSQRLRFGSIDVLPLGEALKDCLALISPSSES